MKKHCFVWIGISSNGQKLKAQSYEINADLLKIKLSKQGFHHVKVRRQLGFFANKIRYKDITYFTRQLFIMLKAGLPLLKALDVLNSSSGPLQSIIPALYKDIEEGKSLADSLQSFPQHFDCLFCQLIKLGELAGILDSVLMRLAEHREKIESLKKSVFKALAYPCMVLIIAICISLALLIFIVPQFQTLFAEFNAPLPLFTQAVISFSEALKQYGLSLGLGWAVILAGIIRLKKRSNKLKQAWDKLILALPIVGQLIEKALLIRLSRTLSLMLNAGMPLSQAIPLLSRTFNNQVYQFAMAKSLEQLKQGRPFYQALQQSGRFPTLLIQMLQIGEESGKLECMLDKAANLYQEELDHAVDMLKELLEPCMMALLGLIVGSLVIAIYLPIFNLAGVM